MLNLFPTPSFMLRRHLHLQQRVNWICSITAKRTARGSVRNFGKDSRGDYDSDKTMYFHVAPSGDWWTGPSIFAAKHLQPDYVRSIPMPPGFDPSLCFSDDEDEDDEEEFEHIQRCEQQQKQQTASKEYNNETKIIGRKGSTQQFKQTLSWDEQKEVLHKIYDEGEIPPRLFMVDSSDEKDET